MNDFNRITIAATFSLRGGMTGLAYTLAAMFACTEISWFGGKASGRQIAVRFNVKQAANTLTIAIFYIQFEPRQHLRSVYFHAAFIDPRPPSGPLAPIPLRNVQLYSIPSSYSVLVPISVAPAVHGPAETPLPVVTAGGFSERS